MKGVEFVRLGGKMRPVAFNMNVVKDMEKHFLDEKHEIRERLINNAQRMLDETGKNSIEELSREEILAAYQDSQSMTDYTIYQIYSALKEGARKTGQEFKVPDIRVEWSEEKEAPVEQVMGTREATAEDVSEWLEEAEDTSALDTISDMIGDGKFASKQADSLERHMARMDEDEKKT